MALFCYNKNQKTDIHDMVIKQLKQAIQKRRSLETVTNAIRLVNGKGDGLPGLVIEQYNRHFVIHFYNPEAKRYLDEAANYIKTEFNPAFLIIKDRLSSERTSLDNPKMRIVIEKEKPQTVVVENGLKFRVDLNDTVNSGLFLDTRHIRKRIGSEARGKSVLNCFAYTCSFGVYARCFGANRVINVDISRKNLEKGMKNYELNGLSFEPGNFNRRDCIEYLKKAGKKNNSFDMIILDPPSFSRTGGKVFSVEKHLSCLIEMASNILSPSGLLFVSTNWSAMSTNQLKTLVLKKASGLKKNVLSTEVFSQDIDFSGSGFMKESSLAAVLTKFA